MASKVNYQGSLTTDLKFQFPVAQQLYEVPKLNITIPILGPNGSILRLRLLLDLWKTSGKSQSSADGSQSSVDGASNDVLNNTNLSGLFGNIFSSGLSTAGNTIFNNVIKGTNLTEGLAKDVGNSVLGTASGLTANLIGQGINKLGGDSMLSRGVGQGIATGLGSVGGTVLSNLINTGKVAGTASKLFGTGNNILTTTKTVKDAAENVTKATLVGAINPYALGASIVGTGLSAVFGPSKEYNGRYGNITKTMDSAYDAIQGAVGFIPGYGQAISGAMALNKGLSNIFGSTDGMTKTDAILGSAFMPAPVKWVNMWGSSKTGNFDNQSWQNIEKANSFMGNAFGDLNDKFELAREEANKRYGTFSQGAKRRALRNIDFANSAWGDVLAMADQNELQNIRSLYMSSINNQRYAQMIQGGYNPLAIGRQGMKILNNETNHNMGLRLLSAAALIDNKQMILSAQGGTKITRLKTKPLPKKPTTREENPELWDEWKKREAEQQAARLHVYNQEQQAATQRAETNAQHAHHYSNLATGMAETAQQNTQFEPITQESLQNSNTERLRLEQLADKNEYFDNGMKFINAAGFADLGVNIAAPLLQRGFKWAFNKAGLLVKVPLEKTNLFLTSPYTGKWTLFGNKEYRFKPGYVGINGVPVESRPIENNLTSHLQGDEAVKMFKEYGGTPIPEGSINGELLRKYVAEARERYGLTGNNNITDEEIAQALYKHSKELGGNTAAVNTLGEPLLLFRGSTKRNTELHPKGTGELPVSGADNILGNLFLGELPGTRPGLGLERYLGLKQGWLGEIPPQTNAAKVVGNKVSYPLYDSKRFGLVEKLSPESMEFGANDINAFVVRTPKVRDATEEIVVLNPLSSIPENKLLGSTHSEHYHNLIKLAESKNEGLLRSDPRFIEVENIGYKGGSMINGVYTPNLKIVRKELIPQFRDEHEHYTYFALPNFNIRNAKHLLPYDLRIPRDWTNPNIYKAVVPYVIGGSTAATLYNKSK